MTRLRQALSGVDDWNESSIEQALRSLAEETGVGAGKLIHPFRVAITGTAASAGIFEVAALLGRDRVLHRLDSALIALRDTASLAREDA
jgi:glutamyl-tRNA synthetase